MTQDNLSKPFQGLHSGTKAQPSQSRKTKVRVFVDTNVLINYFENRENNFSKEFIEEASKKEFIELVTSDFVIFEVIEFFRKEFYFKNRMNAGWFSRSARKRLKGFQKLSDEDWNNMKSYVESILAKIEEKIEIIKLEDFISKDLEMEKRIFKYWVYLFSLNTKIDMKDILILLSALRMEPQPHIFLTEDDEFRKEGQRISMLEELLRELPISLTLKFYSPKPPENMSIEEYLNILKKLSNSERKE